jgi:alpha-methylacyl-CoA racemase
MERCGITDDDLLQHQNDRSRWPEFKQRLATLFKTRTRDQWCELMEGTDICFAPVLDWAEAPNHPHNVARGTFVQHEGVVQPAAAPRFSRTPGAAGPVDIGDAASILKAWGL